MGVPVIDTGPFTVEAVPFPTVLTLDETQPAQEADAAIARSGESQRQHSWRDELLKTGIRGKGGQMLKFAELEALRAVLDVASSDEKFDFYLYHDADLETYRHFNSCSTVRFDYDVTDKNRFRYAILLHADDPTIYTTGP